MLLLGRLLLVFEPSALSTPAGFGRSALDRGSYHGLNHFSKPFDAVGDVSPLVAVTLAVQDEVAIFCNPIPKL